MKPYSQKLWNSVKLEEITKPSRRLETVTSPDDLSANRDDLVLWLLSLRLGARPNERQNTGCSFGRKADLRVTAKDMRNRLELVNISVYGSTFQKHWTGMVSVAGHNGKSYSPAPSQEKKKLQNKSLHTLRPCLHDNVSNENAKSNITGNYFGWTTRIIYSMKDLPNSEAQWREHHASRLLMVWMAWRYRGENKPPYLSGHLLLLTSVFVHQLKLRRRSMI